MALTCSETRSARGSADRDGSYNDCSVTIGTPAARVASPPTTSLGCSTSSSACNSSGGNRCDTGAGVAPSAQHAKATSRKAMPFGRAMATKSPASTPAACSARARRCTRAASSARVSVRSSQLSAGRCGSRAAWTLSSRPIGSATWGTAGAKCRGIVPVPLNQRRWTTSTRSPRTTLPTLLRGSSWTTCRRSGRLKERDPPPEMGAHRVQRRLPAGFRHDYGADPRTMISSR